MHIAILTSNTTSPRAAHATTSRHTQDILHHVFSTTSQVALYLLPYASRPALHPQLQARRIHPN